VVLCCVSASPTVVVNFHVRRGRAVQGFASRPVPTFLLQSCHAALGWSPRNTAEIAIFLGSVSFQDTLSCRPVLHSRADLDTLVCLQYIHLVAIPRTSYRRLQKRCPGAILFLFLVETLYQKKVKLGNCQLVELDLLAGFYLWTSVPTEKEGA
jgi:hypothetical protein